MNKEKFMSYATIKTTIKELTAQAKEIEAEVVAEMEAEGVDKVSSDVGTFSFTRRKTYEYPEYVQTAENTFKELKKKSEDIGDATFTETKSLTFRGGKDGSTD